MDKILNHNYLLFILLVLSICAIVFLFIMFPIKTSIFFTFFMIFMIFLHEKKTGALLFLITLYITTQLIIILIHRPLPMFFYLSFPFVVFVFFWSNLFFGEKLTIPFTLFDKTNLVFIIYLIFSVIFISSNKSYGFEKLRYFAGSLTIMYVVIITFRNILDIEKIFKAVFFLGLILSIYSMFSYYGIERYFSRNYYGRFSTLDINPIWVARYFSFTILVNIYYIKGFFINPMKNLGKITILVLLSLIQLFFLLITASRGPLLGLITALLIMILSNIKLDIKKIVITVLLIVLIIGLISVFVPNKTRERILSEDDSGQSSSLLRILANYEALRIFWGHKLLGIGFGSYKFGGQIVSKLIYPHNILTEILSETGIIGFILLASIIIHSIIMLFRIRKKIHLDLFILIMGFYLASFINANLSGHMGSNEFFWLSIGIIYSIYLHDEYKKKKI